MADTQLYLSNVITTGLGLPPGTVVAFGGSSVPSGYVLCDGTAISRTTFATLFALIGTTYGVGDGSTTFNVPDCRGRAPFGKAASGTFGTLGGNGGAESYSHTLASHTHTYSTSNHSHTTGSHTHTIQLGGAHFHFNRAAGGVLQTGSDFYSDNVVATDHNHGGTTGGAAPSTGTTDAPLDSVGATTSSDSNVNPFAVVNFVIKT